MAEEVEIKNFGDGGVASEATLKSLVAAVEKMGGKGSGAGAKVQDLHNKAVQSGIKVSTKHRDAVKRNTESVKKSSQALNQFASTIKGSILGGLGALASGLAGFTNELLTGGTELSDFAQHIPLVGGLLTPLTGYIDRSIGAFRELSSVGASFNNSIEDMRRAAATSGMTLDEYSGFVSANSETLRLLGGTVTGGVTAFGAINKELKKTGRFTELKELGFTVMDINEGLSGYAALQSRMGRLQGQSTAELASGAGNYLKQLDRLAKATGKSREELENQMAAQAQDAGFRAILNSLSGDAADNFRESMTLIGTIGGSTATALQDLADGVPQTEEAIALVAAAGPGIVDVMQQVANGADPQILIDALATAGGEIEGFAGATGTERAAMIASLRDTNPALASILDEATKLIEIGSTNLDQAAAEQAAREETTEKLATFDDAIRDIRETIQVALLDSGIFDTLAGAFAGATDVLKDTLASEGFRSSVQEIADKFKTFMDDIREFGFKQAFQNLFKDVDFGQMVKDFLFGSSSSVDNSEQIAQKDEQLAALGAEAGDLGQAAYFSGGELDESAAARLEEIHAQMAQIRAERDALAAEEGAGSGGIFGSVFGDLSVLETGAATVAGLLGAGGAVYLAISGLKALVRGFGNPQVAAGAAVFTGMLIGTGASIKLAGDGISAAGDGIKKVAEGVEQLGSIQDTANFENIADSLGKIGPALISLTAGGVLESITSFFGADSPFEKLRDGINEFGDIDPTSIANLRTAGEGLNVFTSLTDTLDEGPINRYAEAIENLAESMERLNEALADKNNSWGETGVSVGTLAGEQGGLFGGSGMSEEKINELNNTMMQAVAALNEIRQINTRQLTAMREIGNVV